MYLGIGRSLKSDRTLGPKFRRSVLRSESFDARFYATQLAAFAGDVIHENYAAFLDDFNDYAGTQRK